MDHSSHLVMYDPAQANRNKKTIIYFLAAVTMYLCFLVVHYFSKAEALKLVANGFAFFIFILFLLKILLQPTLARLNIFYVSAFALLVFGMLGNAIANYGSTNFSDYLKMALSPFFFVIGYCSLNVKKFQGDTRFKLLFFTSVILVMPVLIALGEMAIWGAQFREGESISIFANRNNAALYAIVLSILFLVLGISRRWLITYLLLVAVLFGTLGVFVAVTLSIFIVSLSRKNAGYLLALPLALLLLLTAAPNLPVFERLLHLGEGLVYLFTIGEIRHILEMSYGELSELMGGSSDVSFFFRIKHWLELFQTYAGGTLMSIFFGRGVGSSVLETSLELVPHNDYLRYLYECGIAPFLGFLILNLRILVDIGRNYFAIPFITISIYFFTENLINNFLAMMLYYFLAGFIIVRSKALAKQKARYEHFASQPKLFCGGRLG